jgi:hypothetical protein
MCRKAHGAGYATFVTAKGKDFRYAQGDDLVVRYRSSADSEREFCHVCGSSLAVVEESSGDVYVAAGTLDDDPGLRLESHIFMGSKAPWIEVTDGRPAFDEYAPEDE